MNNLLAVAIVAGVFGFFWWIIRLAKRQNEDRERVSQELGFTKLPSTPAEFQTRIESLHQEHRGKVRISNLFMRGCGRYDLYVFDLTKGQSDDSDRTSAIVSHDFSLPPFRIFPAMPFTGRIAGWIEKLASHMAAKQGFAEYTGMRTPQFSRRYRLYVKDEQAVQQNLPDEVWENLAGMEPSFALSGQDDIIVFSEFQMNARSTPSAGAEAFRILMRQKIDQADRLHRIYGEARHLQSVR